MLFPPRGKNHTKLYPKRTDEAVVQFPQMKRLRRWLLNGFAAMALLLCVATLALWIPPGERRGSFVSAHPKLPCKYDDAGHVLQADVVAMDAVSDLPVRAGVYRVACVSCRHSGPDRIFNLFRNRAASRGNSERRSGGDTQSKKYVRRSWKLDSCEFPKRLEG